MASVSGKKKSDKWSHPKLRTPRLYKSAAQIIQAYDRDEGGLKSLIYKSKHFTKARLNALVCKVLSHRNVLNHIISETRLDQKPVDQYLLKVLVYEELFNKKLLTGNSKAVCCARDNLNVLQNALSEFLATNSLETVSQKSGMSLLSGKLPRYARVNTLKTTVAEVNSTLEHEGYAEVKYDSNISHEKYIDLVKSLQPHEYLKDLHINPLLVFHPKTKFCFHSLYHNRKLLLQDKASCFPALLLNPKPGSYILDACAAPGMKTTHLAALINNNGTIVAQDRNSDRLNAMEKILHLAKATCVRVNLGDFSSVNPKVMPYKKVKYILVDPSCSGSGMVKRALLDERSAMASKERLLHLSEFQKKLLQKALDFPNVQRVVYSTCSIHREENEDVVKYVLEKYHDHFDLLELPTEWPFVSTDPASGGEELFMSKCLKTLPERDLTNGFFVAVFERKGLRDEKQPKSAEARLRKKPKMRKIQKKVLSGKPNEDPGATLVAEKPQDTKKIARELKRKRDGSSTEKSVVKRLKMKSKVESRLFSEGDASAMALSAAKPIDGPQPQKRKGESKKKKAERRSKSKGDQNLKLETQNCTAHEAVFDPKSNKFEQQNGIILDENHRNQPPKKKFRMNSGNLDKTNSTTMRSSATETQSKSEDPIGCTSNEQRSQTASKKQVLKMNKKKRKRNKSEISNNSVKKGGKSEIDKATKGGDFADENVQTAHVREKPNSKLKEARKKFIQVDGSKMKVIHKKNSLKNKTTLKRRVFESKDKKKKSVHKKVKVEN